MSIIKIKTIISVSALAFIFLLPALSRAYEYDFYVDKNSSVATEDGSEQYPFKTIGAALSHIQSEGLKSEKIFVKTGTYTESINLVNNTKIIGESESETIIDATGFRNGVNFVKTKSEIKNITIKSANSTNIIIDKKSKATIKNCTIKKAGSFGIEVEKSSTKDRYKFTIKNSKISENDSKGFHISKRKILISGNEVFDNGEEGIDLHSGQKGTVSGNDIRGNDESGIEAILSSGVKLTLKKNKIKNNHSQGITIQSYSAKKKGKVKISKNTINGNHNYGIRYANYTRSIGPNKFRIFIDKCVKLSGNEIEDNDDGDFAYE